MAVPAKKKRQKPTKIKGGHIAVVSKNKGEVMERKSVAHHIARHFTEKDNIMSQSEVMDSMLQQGYIGEGEIAKAFAAQHGVEFIENLEDYKISKDVLEVISRKTCERYTIIPIMKVEKTLVVAFSDPSNIHIRDTLSLTTNLKIQPVIAVKSAIKKMLGRCYDSQKEVNELFYDFDVSINMDEGNSVDLMDEKAKQDNSPSISFVNLVFSDAIQLGASDIHIESYEKALRVRYRIDGILHEKHVLPKEMAASIISRIKVISNMDISEKRKPQDARLKIHFDQKELNMRINSTPTVSGEKVVLRLLDDSILKKGIIHLGMEDFQKKMFLEAINKPQGLVLMTGPTGSGKTTTIYSGLMKLNTPDCNISTVEDPVEFRIHGINQVQVNPKVGLDFSAALRAFLRQDPDVILVGEIRDLETAEIAYKAAATGHLVLSTLHTNDTVSTLNRLMNMGIPSYSVAGNTSIIIAQRLLRKLCMECRKSVNVTDKVLMEIGAPEDELDLYHKGVYEEGEGCKECDSLGYSGRVAVYEMLSVTPEIKHSLFKSASPAELKEIAVQKNNMVTLRMSALLKLRMGQVSIQEVIRGTVGD